MLRRLLLKLSRISSRAQSSGAAGGAKPSPPPTAPKPAASGGGGGKKKGKVVTSHKPWGGSGPRYGHGSDDRPRRDDIRLATRAARSAELGGGGEGTGSNSSISPAVADPVLAALLTSSSSAAAGGAEAAAALTGVMRGLEEPDDVRTAAASARFSNVPSFAEEFKGRVAAVPDTEDWGFLTDADVEDEMGEKEMERSEAKARAHRRRAPLLHGAASAAIANAQEADSRISDLARGLLKDDAGLIRAQQATKNASITAANDDATAPPPWGIPGAKKGLFFSSSGLVVSPETAMGLGDARLGNVAARALRGLPARLNDIERQADFAAFDEEHSSRLMGPSGDDARDIPRGILEEFSSPLDFADLRSSAGRQPPPSTLLETFMTPAERELNEKRKMLRKLVETPLAVATRPLWPLYALVVGADQVRLVTGGGVIDSVRCMVVVGNGRGGVGMGLATHRDAEAATKRALSLAQRDMIHVATRGGALHHDLIGKKNNVYVLLRATPATGAASTASPALLDVLELAGVTTVSAKIFGSHRRSPYVVMQALFDAFNFNKPPEADAERLGLRLVRHTADRDVPRTVYPFSPAGPRFPSAGSKFIKGMPSRP